MKNEILLLLCSLMLSSCCWERQIAIYPGDANISNESVCISSSRGKNLSFYSVEARKLRSPHDGSTMMVSKLIQSQTPYCFKLKVESLMGYTLFYRLDNKPYTVDFITDSHSNIYSRHYTDK